jgi:hypothetical protein
VQLVKMNRELVTEWWDVIKESIRHSVPPFVAQREEVMGNLLKAILEGRLTCWGALEEDKATTILTTAMMREGLSQTLMLWIYTIYAFEIMEREYYATMFKELRHHARTRGCSKIITYSCNEDVINILDSLGADTTFRFVTIPL